MQIYTKTGDSGDTGLPGGQRTRKSNLRIEVCGQLDELNALIGLVRSEDTDAALDSQLEKIQSRLFVVGAQVAASGTGGTPGLPRLPREQIHELEYSIDEMQDQLPELRNFVLPGGSRPAALLHLARTVCRRCERWLVRYVDEHPGGLDDGTLAWVNRLGDWLFVAARRMNVRMNIEETIWVSGNVNQSPKPDDR